MLEVEPIKLIDIMIEKTLVLLKPCTMQRALAGEIISVFEKKGLQICGMKMMQLDDKLLSEHYAHLAGKPFFQQLKDSMMVTPVVALCLSGVDAVETVRNLAGATNGRKAEFGTIRGDDSLGGQENIIHTADSVENARIELDRFFVASDYCCYEPVLTPFIYAPDEK